MPGLRACWAKPLPHLEDHNAGPRKPGLVRGGWSGGALLGSGRPDDEEEALMSSKVHWVVASIAVPGDKPGVEKELMLLERHLLLR